MIAIYNWNTPTECDGNKMNEFCSCNLKKNKTTTSEKIIYLLLLCMDNTNANATSRIL